MGEKRRFDICFFVAVKGEGVNFGSAKPCCCFAVLGVLSLFVNLFTFENKYGSIHCELFTLRHRLVWHYIGSLFFYPQLRFFSTNNQTNIEVTTATEKSKDVLHDYDLVCELLCN